MSGLDASLSMGKLKNAETGLAGLGNKMKNLAGLGGGASSAIGGVGASLGTLGTAGIAIGTVVGLGAALFSCAQAAEEDQKILAQTNAVIESTGGVANVTAGHVDELGNKLAAMSGISHDTIKSGENILLTFRGIQNQTGKNNDIFDQATAATLDLSVAMGRDMNKSAIMVGKALQDPVKGLTAMRRVGVAFTADQENMIKNMVAVGDTMGAQKIILAELKAEFGGSAAAFGGTLEGQIGKMKDQFDQLKEAVGAPLLAPLIAGFQVLTTVMNLLPTGAVSAAISGLALGMASMVSPLTAAAAAWKMFTGGAGKVDVAQFDGTRKSIAGIVEEIKKAKGENIIIHTEAATKNAKELQAELEKATGKKVTIDTSGAAASVNDLDTRVQQLDQDIQDALDVPSAEVKRLEDTLALKGIKGVDKDLLKPMLDQLKADEPVVRDEGEKMAKDLVDALGRSNPAIKENASKIGDDIAMGVEQARALGPVTDKKMAEIVLSVIKASGPVDAAGQVMLDNLQAIINGTPLVITPEVKIDKFKTPTDMFKDIMSGQTADVEAKVNVDTAQASQNVTGLKANMESIQDKGVTASTETAQASQNVTGLRNNIAGLQSKTITITTLINEVKTKVSPEKSWSSAFAAGGYVAGEIGAGMKANAPKMAMTAGIDPASAALTSTFGSFIAEMNAAPILEVENAINGLTTADWGNIAALNAQYVALDKRSKALELASLHAEDIGDKAGKDALDAEKAGVERAKQEIELQNEINQTNKTNEESLGIWRNANAAYEAATAGLTKYETKLKTAQTAIDKYNEKLQASEARASKAQAALDKLSSMKLLGEGAAADKAFAQDEASKKLQLEIMQAEDAHQYAKVAALTLEKEKLDRTKEEADLQTSITYDPQRRDLEKLLDPLKGREMSETEITKQIKAAQATLAKEAITQSIIKKHIDQQTKSMKLLQDQYDAAKLKVDKFKEQIDKLASFFVSKYRDMASAVTDLNNAIGGGGTIPSYQAGTSFVPATGLAVVHKGEQITPALRPIQMHTTSDTQVTIPLYLDGKVLAKTVTKIQGGNASAYAMSGGKY